MKTKITHLGTLDIQKTHEIYMFFMCICDSYFLLLKNVQNAETKVTVLTHGHNTSNFVQNGHGRLFF
jgi:hypothetical protein